jgi:hypothetical protein
MRRAKFVAGAVAAVALMAVAAPVGAAPVGFSVVIVAHTDFTVEASDFDSNLPGCADGTVVNGGGGPHFTPLGGTFVGDKVFTCAGGDSGFTIQLTARFGGGGSTGHWTLSDAWGDLAGIKGSGSLVGIPVTPTSIDDIYTGSLR